MKLTSTASFEHLFVRISSSSKSVIGLVVYRTGAASSLFYKEFEDILGILDTYNEEVLILGDFSFHLEQSDNTDAQTFLNIQDPIVLIRPQTNPPITKEDGLM